MTPLFVTDEPQYTSAEEPTLDPKLKLRRDYKICSVCPHCGAPIYEPLNPDREIEVVFTCWCRVTAMVAPRTPYPSVFPLIPPPMDPPPYDFTCGPLYE